MRKLLLALASFLASQALQMSGYQNPELAAVLLCISGFLVLWTFVTWEPVVKWWRESPLHRFVRPVPAASEMGLFDIRRVARRLHEGINPIMLPIRKLEEEIAHISAAYRPRIGALAQADDDATEQRLYQTVLREAKEINKRLDRMSRYAAKFDDLADVTVRNFDAMALVARDHPERLNLVTLRDSMAALAETMEKSRGIEESFGKMMSLLHGWTSEMNATSMRGAEVAARIVTTQDRIRDACRRASEAAAESIRSAAPSKPQRQP